MRMTPVQPTSHESQGERTGNIIYQGIPASRGIAIGPAYVLDREHPTVAAMDIDPEQVEREVERFRTAVARTKQEFARIQRNITDRLGQEKARIFDAHLLMLEDSMAIDETVEGIRRERKNAECLFFQNLEKVRATLLATGEEYLKERAVDIQDVERRVLRNLMGQGDEGPDRPETPHVLVAPFLTPSDTAQLDRTRVLGFITELGGRTSHGAIMARSLDIPAVVGLQNIRQKVRSGDLVVVDGSHGIVLLNPDEATIGTYQEKREVLAQREKRLLALADKPALTLDGLSVELQANIELPEEVEAAVSHGARGIGLYRTEYLYLARTDLPGEEEQYQAYAAVADRIAPAPVVIRTVDLGGDKFPTSLNMPQELNPYLGWRAIRICLERRDLFKTQLRAMLRASRRGNVRIMFPMISGLEELLKVKAILGEVKDELRTAKVAFDEQCQTGIMIEVPSAALMADQLAREVDFFSIGTNDLIQYTLAVDRNNEKIAHLYDPLHPAVLRLIQRVISAAHEKGLWVGLCGELAGDPLCVWLLLGLGLDEFSVSPVALPETKRLIRSVSSRDAQQMARKVLSLKTTAEVSRFLVKQLSERLSDFPVDYELELVWSDYGRRGG